MITHAWRIIHIQGEQVLLCLLCDRYSRNPNDRANRYCGFCHEWLDTVPGDYPGYRPQSTQDADRIIAATGARERASLEALRSEAALTEAENVAFARTERQAEQRAHDQAVARMRREEEPRGT